MAVWPAYRDLGMQNVLEGMPDGVRAALLGDAFDHPEVERNSFYTFIVSELTAWLPFVLAYFGVSVGGGVVARAYGRRTIDLMLAHPITRERFLLTRFAAVILGAVIIVAGSLVGMLIGVSVWAGNTLVSATDIVLVHVQLLLFGLAVAALSLCLAAWLLEPGRTYGVSALIMVVMYTLTLVAQFVEPLQWMGYASLFRYWQPLEQFTTGNFSWAYSLVLTGSSVVGLALAVVVFRRRDIVT